MASPLNGKWRVCRICLKQPEVEMKEIFSKKAKSDLTNKIMNCGGIPINQLDGFPNKMCNQCFSEMEVAHKFRITCQSSYQLLSTFRFTVSDQKTLPDMHVEEITKIESENTEPDNVEFIATYSSEEHIENWDGKKGQHTMYYLEDSITASDEEEHEYEEERESICRSKTLIVREKNLNQKREENKDTIKKPKTKHKNVGKDDKQHIAVVNFDVVSEFSDRLSKRAKQTIKTENTFICYLCGNIYNTKYKLNTHLKQHNKEKAYECEICHKLFSTSPQLSRHMNSHTGNRPFKCKMCPASFSDPSTCIKHQRIHTNERPFKCDECGKSFAYSNVLKVHKMIHTGEKPFSCETCGKKFSQRHHKKAHDRTHMNSKHVKAEFDEADELYDVLKYEK